MRTIDYIIGDKITVYSDRPKYGGETGVICKRYTDNHFGVLMPNGAELILHRENMTPA